MFGLVVDSEYNIGFRLIQIQESVFVMTEDFAYPSALMKVENLLERCQMLLWSQSTLTPKLLARRQAVYTH